MFGHRVDFYTYSDRIRQCSICEHLDETNWRCGKCGCYITKKARMSTEECPDDNWNNLWNKPTINT